MIQLEDVVAEYLRLTFSRIGNGLSYHAEMSIVFHMRHINTSKYITLKNGFGRMTCLQTVGLSIYENDPVVNHSM